MSTAANPKADQLHPSDAPQESTGAVASDSLAAESIKAGGEFAENDNAAISSVKGANSTLNTTDTSGATVLTAAKDGTERAREEAKGLGADEKGVTGAKYPETIGQAEFSGTHSQEGYVGGASTDSKSTSTGGSLPSGATGDSFADGGAGLTGSSSTSDSKVSSGNTTSKGAGTTTSSGSGSSGSTSAPASGTGVRATGGGSGTSADTAPNYAATVAGTIRPEGEDKPKGENVTEGGIPETKTFTGDVGGVHDPGRLATKDFTKVGPGNAASAGETGGAQGDSGPQITGGQYDVLESERA